MKMRVMRYLAGMVGCTVLYGGVSRQADTVFQRWIDHESVYVHNQFCDRKPSDMINNLNRDYVERVNHKIAQNSSLMAPFMPFLSMPHDVPVMHTDSFTFSLNDSLTQALTHLYTCLDEPTKIPGFLRFLRNHGLSSDAINHAEVDEDFNRVLEKYIAFMEILFSDENEFVQQQNLLAVANRMFEFCFEPTTWPEFKQIIDHAHHYPLGRLLYTTMWYNLASVGWKEWHQSCLHKLKHEANEGKEVVYIAGGCDIYAMIKEGIYNIRIIDPMLPTQPAYYIPDWFWFVQGEGKRQGMGDTLTFSFPDRTVTMKRSYYRQHHDFFDATLCDDRVERLQKSETRWTLYDEKRRHLGTITFERRFCTQQDFTPSPHKVMLLSFNELYYVTTCDDEEGWGIKPTDFPDDMMIYIKQLRNPVTKPMMCYMHDADGSSFQFIKLGTCVN